MNLPYVRLGDVAQLINGDRGKNYPSEGDFTENGVPFINAGHLRGGIVDFSTMNYISTEHFRRLGNGKTERNDLLYCLRGSLGKIAIVDHDGPSAIASSLVIIRSQYDHRFLYQFLSSPLGLSQIKKFDNGSSQPNLSAASLKEFQIPLPPLEDQRRIAGILDRADELRAKRRAALAQLDELTQAIFLDMFGDPATNPKVWPIEVLENLVSEFRYGTSNKSGLEGKPTLRIPNVAGGVVDLKELKLVSVDDAEFVRLRLNDGDLLFVRTNGNPDFVGRCALFDSRIAAQSGFPGTDFVFASYLIRARLTGSNVLPLYLREYLLGKEGRRQLRSRSKTSAGQFNINTVGLGAVPVPVPPIELQHEFARRVTAVETLKTAHSASLVELDALFAALQHRAFRGDL